MNEGQRIHHLDTVGIEYSSRFTPYDEKEGGDVTENAGHKRTLDYHDRADALRFQCLLNVCARKEK